MRSPLWSPSQQQINSSVLHEFMALVKTRTGHDFKDYDALWQWSVRDKEIFWDLVWDFCGVIGDKGTRVLDDNGGQMFGAQFFPDASLNYAENLLQSRDDGCAMIFRDEQGVESQITRGQLYDDVSRWQQAMTACGVGAGDRVAGYMPNMMETITAALAAISLGAVWSSASPDFGVQGVVDRFGQIEPKLLITVDGYYYNGKVIDVLGKVRDIQPQLKGLVSTIVVPFAGSDLEVSALPNTQSADDFIGEYTPSDIVFTRVAFNHPLFIMFSSGTTGAPKCIVHGHGGTLLQHLKEHQLQSNIKSGDKVFYFTTCGWMMWNWLVSALSSNATLLLFDGSPFYPDGNVLWDYTSAHECMLFGTSAKYIEAMKTNDIVPKKTHDLSHLRAMTSTGSPLVPSSFDYVYDAVKSDLHLASISGGTDIVSCFLLGNPVSPVYRGEIQCAGLGMALDVFDDDGTSTRESSGEMVCTQPFPSMPVSFWNDVDGARYREAYFDRFDNIWCHGDWIEKTENSGFIIHGRSDATLNPGGVRIGTAELYGQVEKIFAVQDCVAIGQNWEEDVRIILFVILNEGCTLDDDLIKEIKTQIRKGASPRHVPAKIIAVSDIPRTKSGKITEIAVRDVVMGRPIKNVEALANPEALDLYRDLEELRS
ncbi:MAG: acetoacetate--CoA ligase [Alphaproteobacteria bacterium]|nr:MAG: acetoacetate--CoA ligase [Alphaproteobacteria bacterium]